MIIKRVIRYFEKDSQELIETAFFDAAQNNNYFECFYPLVIEDSFEGSIVCLDDVTIRKNARFSGELICKKCLIEGFFNGHIVATEYIKVSKNAGLNARISTVSICVENQASAVGELNICKEINKPDVFKKLENLYRNSSGTTEDLEVKPKKIILKKGCQKTLSILPGEIPSPDIKKTGNEMSVSKISFQQAQSSAPTQVVDNTNSGWW